MPADPTPQVLRYGSHPEQLADLRLPETSAAALVLLVHGGFWRQEWDRHHTDPTADDLVARGYAVATLEYRRLGGDGGWPATFDDVAAAVDRVPALAASVSPGLSHAPVALLGHSAGGQLVLWAAGRHRLPADSDWHLPVAPDIHGVVALAPVADLRFAGELGLDDDVVGELFGEPGPERDARVAGVDPSRLAPAARVVVVHGDRDKQVPLAVGQRYVTAVRALGADVSLDELAGVDHFALISPGSAAWPHVLAALERVLAQR